MTRYLDLAEYLWLGGQVTGVGAGQGKPNERPIPVVVLLVIYEEGVVNVDCLDDSGLHSQVVLT